VSRFSLHNKGFTLLEVVVVIFLIATFSAVGVLNLGIGKTNHLQSEAVLLKRKLDLLTDESIFSGKTYKVIFEEVERLYRFEVLQGKKWVKFEEQPFIQRQVPSDFAFSYSKESSTTASASEGVVFQPDGVIDNFQFQIGMKLDSRSTDFDDDRTYWLLSNSLERGLVLEEGECKYPRDLL